MIQTPPLTIVSAQKTIRSPAYLRRTRSSLVDLSTPHTAGAMDLILLGDYLMKSVLECAAGCVVLTIVLIRGFCWGGDFVGLLRNRMPNINNINMDPDATATVDNVEVSVSVST